MKNRLSRTLPVAVFALVLLVRLVYVVSLERSVLSRWHEWEGTDEHGTLLWSARLAAGHWLDSPPFRHYADWQAKFGTEAEWNSWYPKGALYQGALYPYAVAVVRVVCGSPILATRLLQGLLAALSAATLAAAVRNLILRRGGSREALVGGAVAGLLAGLYAPAVFQDGFVLRDGPLLSISILLVACPLILDTRRARSSLLTGLLGGAAILLKQTLAPLAFVSVWAASRDGEAGPGGRRRLLFGAAGIALPLLLLVGRNLAVGTSPFAFDTRQVVGFAGYVSNGSDATVVPSPRIGEILSKAKGSSLKTALLALESYRGNPAGLLVLTGKKVAAFFNGFEVPDNANFYLFRRRLFPLRWLPVYACILGPGLVGLVLVARRKMMRPAETALLAVAFLVPLVSCLLPTVTSRYRLGVCAPLAFGTGLLAAFLVSRSAAKEKTAAVAAAVLVSMVTLLPSVIPDSRRRASDEQFLAILERGPR